jgi:hypothetical protein
MIEISAFLIYLNLQVLAVTIHDMFQSKKYKFPDAYRYAIVYNLMKLKQGKFKDIAEGKNEMLLYPMSDVSYFKKTSCGIEFAESGSGEKYCLCKKDPLFKYVDGIFSSKANV